MKPRLISLLAGAAVLAAIVAGPHLLPQPQPRIGSTGWATEIATITLCDAMNNPRVPRFVAATTDRTTCIANPGAPLRLCDAIHRPDGTPRRTPTGPTHPDIIAACEVPVLQPTPGR